MTSRDEIQTPLLSIGVPSVNKARYRLLGILSLCALIIAASCKDKSSDTITDVDAILTNAPRIPIGHKVRVRSTAATQTARMNGKSGTLSGFTTPSVSGEQVIGAAKSDIAFAVQFSDPDTLLWFAPELLEFIDRTSKLEIEIYGKRWVWLADGTLLKSPDS